jgi:hypothetical protein
LDTVIKSLAGLSDLERKACHHLNFRGGGYMQNDLREYAGRDDCLAIMLWESDALQGWALLLPTKIADLYCSRYAKRHSKYLVQIYVRASKRGKGLGHDLMGVALGFDPKPHVFPHDPRSAAFFARYDVTCEQKYRQNLNQAKRGKPRAA